MNAFSPEGLIFVEFHTVNDDALPLSKALSKAEYEIEIEFKDKPDLKEIINEFLSQRNLMVYRTHKKKGEILLDIRPFIDTMNIVEFSSNRCKICIKCFIIDGRTIRPEEVAGLMFKDCENSVNIVSINRLGIY